MAPIDKDIRMNVYINGTQASNTLKGLNGDIRKMENELRNLPIRSEEYNKKLDELNKKKGVYGALRNEIKQTGTSMRKLGDEASRGTKSITKLSGGYLKYFTILTGGALSIYGLVAGFKKLLNLNAQLSDSMADVAKTTNMSMDEVRDLNEELKSIDTRTSQTELLNLAYVAGRLGETGEKDILGFVRATDKIGVSLGRDLGNTEEAIRSIGKLITLFKVREEYGLEQSFLKVGSAINSLGQASVANEAQIVEITSRIGAIAPQANISIENVMGLASALDQLNLRSEMSSTAVIKTITNMFADTAEYAKVAGIEVNKSSGILNRDANEAFLLVLKGLKGNNQGMQELIGKLKDLGIDGERAKIVLAALSGNIDMVTEAQRLSREEFEKGVSINKEFEVKNNTLAGSFDKLGKAISNAFVNSTLESALDRIFKKITDVINYSFGTDEIQLRLIKIRQLQEQIDTDRALPGFHKRRFERRIEELKEEIKLLEARASINQKYIGRDKITPEDFTIYMPSEEEPGTEKPKTELTEEEKKALEEKLEEQKKQQEKYALYIKQIYKDLQDTAAQIITDARDRELKIEEIAFARKLQQIKGHSEVENRLRTALATEHNQKISDINTKYDKLEAEKRGIVKVKLEDDIHRKIQQNLDQRHQDEWDAEKMFLERTGQMTTDKRREILEQERDMELAAVADNTEKQLLIWEAYYNRLEEIERDHFSEISYHLQGALNSFGKLYGAYVSLENNKDEIRLRQYERNINSRKEILQKSLDDGVITYAQYNNEIKNLDKKLSTERARIAKEQAEREYDYAITMVLLNEAIAIASAIALATTSSKHWVEAIIAIIGAVATVVAEMSLASSKLNEARSYSQFAKGKYNVIGADDGRTYRDVPYTGDPQTGIYQRPALIAEAGPELIVDAPTTRNIQVNYPWIIDAIQYARVPQHAAGTIDAMSSDQSGQQLMIAKDPELIQAIDRLNSNLESGILAKMVYSEFEDVNNKVIDIRTNTQK